MTVETGFGAQRIEQSWSRGQRSRGRKALIGAGVGTAAFFVIVGVVAATYDEQCGPQDYFCRTGETLGIAALGAGAILAIPIGALIGVALPPGERWQRAPLNRVSVGIAPAPRGLGLSVSLSF